MSAVEDCRLFACLIGQEWHVDYNQRATNSTPNGCTVINHLIDGDANCRIESVDDVAELVADENDVDASCINQPGKENVVGSDYDEFLSFALVFFEIPDRKLSLHDFISHPKHPSARRARVPKNPCLAAPDVELSAHRPNTPRHR